MRPSCCTVPAILPPGHHMMVAGAPVPSTVPRQMHMSDFMSTLVRMIVSSVFSLSLTVILAASLEVAGACCVLGQRILDHRGTGRPIMPTPWSTWRPWPAHHGLLLVTHARVRRHRSEYMIPVRGESFTSTPSRAAAAFTAATLSSGTDHISVFVRVSTSDNGSAGAAS